MDKLDKYRKIIVSVVKKHAQYKPSHGKIEALCICDQESDNYLVGRDEYLLQLLINSTSMCNQQNSYQL